MHVVVTLLLATLVFSLHVPNEVSVLVKIGSHSRILFGWGAMMEEEVTGDDQSDDPNTHIREVAHYFATHGPLNTEGKQDG